MASPRAWMTAAVVACAHGIRQEAATELLALPLAQEQLGQLALREADGELREGPARDSSLDPDDRWYDSSGLPCRFDSAHVRFYYMYLKGKGPCRPTYFCVLLRDTDTWQGTHGQPCDPHRPPSGFLGPGAFPDGSWYDEKGVSCKPEDPSDTGHDKFVYELATTKSCTPARFCLQLAGDWKDENGRPCDPPPATGSGRASAMDDPHLVSLRGESFDVKQPGWHSLLQVPWRGAAAAAAAERPQPLLSLDADLRAPEGAPCSLYIKMVALGGSWLDGKVVRIRPASSGGGGGAPQGSSHVDATSSGGSLQQPLSVQVAAAGASTSEAALATDDGLLWAPFGGPDANESLVEASSRMVQALAVRREELGPFGEGQAFRFELLGSGSGQRPRASITVSQGSHQALNVALEGMAGLGHARLGGLLGTEPHDSGLEVPTEKCRESRAQGEGGSLLLGLVDEASGHVASLSRELGGGHEGSRMQAAWE